MPNLLPAKEKKHVRREYNFRRIIAWSLLFAALGIIAGVAIFPSHIMLQEREARLQQKLEKIQSQEETQQSERLSEILQRTEKRLATLEPYDQHIPLYVLIEELLEQSSSEIAINGIRYSRSMIEPSDDADESVEPVERVELEVSGTAESRDALITFKEDLVKAERFDTVNLPVSNLASRQDITFSLNITSEF